MSLATQHTLTKFQISDTAKKILTIDKGLREKIALILNTSDQMVLRHNRINKPNGVLTTTAVVNTIAQSANLTEDQILETVQA